MAILYKNIEITLRTQKVGEVSTHTANDLHVFASVQIESEHAADGSVIEGWLRQGGANLMALAAGLLNGESFTAAERARAEPAPPAELSPEEQADAEGPPDDPFRGRQHGLVPHPDGETPVQRVWRHRAERRRQELYNDGLHAGRTGTVQTMGGDAWAVNAYERGVAEGRREVAAQAEHAAAVESGERTSGP